MTGLRGQEKKKRREMAQRRSTAWGALPSKEKGGRTYFNR